MPKIVQFLHTAEEAKPKNGESFIRWNNNVNHRRKFLVSYGKYINDQGQEEEHELTFWGEWEPQSKIVKIINIEQRPPSYLNQPYIDPSVPNRTHNTDPNVFGKRFKYIVCKQTFFHNVLTNLEENSIILFGSSINQKFCLDTLFVVSRIQQNYTLESIEDLFPKNRRGQYYHASVNPMYDETNYVQPENKEDSCRIESGNYYTYYESADFQDRERYSNIYSYVPCKIYNEGMNTGFNFRQPEIKLDFLNGAQTQGINSRECTKAQIKSYWHQIANQIDEKGLLKGTWFKTPEMARR